jgi:hypothetical protein
MDSNYWSRHGETPFGRAMWFPRTAPPARRGTDPERDEKLESGFLQRRVSFTHRADSVAPRFDPIFTPRGPIRDGPRGAENIRNRLEKRAENPRLRGDGGRD